MSINSVGGDKGWGMPQEVNGQTKNYASHLTLRDSVELNENERLLRTVASNSQCSDPC